MINKLRTARDYVDHCKDVSDNNVEKFKLQGVINDLDDMIMERKKKNVFNVKKD